MKLILAEPFKRLWDGRDAFTEVEQLNGEVYRELEGRRTLRTEVDGRGYFVKIHRGIGWGEVFKNLFTAKLPVLGAGQEWQAINRLHQVGVPTMTAVAYGEKGSNPAAQHSFIITEELAPTVSLEDFSLNWVKQPPQPKLKHVLIAEVARMTGMMHRAGVNHRDCYICHFCYTPTRRSRLITCACRSLTCTVPRPVPLSVAAGATKTWPRCTSRRWTLA